MGCRPQALARHRPPTASRLSQPQPFSTPPPSPALHPQLGELHEVEQWLKTKKLEELSAHDMRQVKQRGFSDSQIARAMGSDMMTGGCRGGG